MRIAWAGVESSEWLDRYCWKTGLSLAWLFGYRRRSTVRCDGHGRLVNAFLALAGAITCYKKLVKLFA